MFFTRTKLYSVYIKKDVPEALDSTVFVSQGFNFWAFLFNMAWSLFNRLWLVSVLLLIFTGFLMSLDSPAAPWIILLANIWFGFEANAFKSAKLERKNYVLFDVVTGIDMLAAKQRFFDKYLFNKSKQPSFPGSSPQAL